MTAKVIQFPRSPTFKPRTHPTSESEVMDAVMTMKLVHVHETLAVLMEMMFDRLFSAGFDFSEMNSEDDQKGAELILEALHSMMLKYYGVSHPFQTMSQHLFVHDAAENEFTLTDQINMEFQHGQTPVLIT